MAHERKKKGSTDYLKKQEAEDPTASLEKTFWKLGQKRLHPRIKIAIATLLAFATFLICLQIWQGVAHEQRLSDSLDAARQPDGERQEAALGCLFDSSGFELTGFSSNPLVIGFVTMEPDASAGARACAGMLSSGWSLVNDASGLYTYSRDPLELWEGRMVSMAYMMSGELDDGCTSILVELI